MLFTELLVGPGLVTLQQDEVFEDQYIHIRCEETTVSIFWCAYDWLTPDIKTRIDDDGSSGQFVEFPDQLQESRAAFINCLHASRVIHVRHSWNLGSLLIQKMS